MDDFHAWREALAGRGGPLNINDPQPGFYRMRAGRGGPWLPVAIWRKGDTLVCRVADKMREPADVWSYCADQPMSKEAAKVAFETGNWPGDVPEAQRDGIGGNSPPATIEDEIADVAASAMQWLENAGIADDVSKDMAANWRAKLLDLAGRADAERSAAVKPHIEAQRQINGKWNPVIDKAKVAAERLRTALTDWMRREDARLRAEAQAKFEAERKAAEAARAKAEAERAQMMADDPIAALTSSEPELPMLPAAPEPVKVQAGGQRGRRTGLRTIKVYTVTDYAAALAHCHGHEAVRAAVEKVCVAQAKAGATVPGITVSEEKVAA